MFNDMLKRRYAPFSFDSSLRGCSLSYVSNASTIHCRLRIDATVVGHIIYLSRA
jgi:hypothetical protein